jgi:flagellar L-ring protein precursor FlgH
MHRRLISPLAFIALAACTSMKDTDPNLAQEVVPAAQSSEQAVGSLASSRLPGAQSAGANSLWRPGARAFFNDQRASRVGDILTVLIVINDSAKTSNSSASSHTAGMSAGVPHLLGLESSLGKILPGGFDPAKAVATNSKTSNAGAGSVTRAEKISLTIAAVVTAVLPNGNMLIQGTQEVRTNNELRQLTVAGIVRPEDISATNTIHHTQIAEARISYGGRGDISQVQKVPAGQSLVERFSLF